LPKERTYAVRVKKNTFVMDWPPGNLDGPPKLDPQGKPMPQPLTKTWKKGDIIEEMPVSILKRHLAQLEVYLGDPTIDDSPLPDKETQEELAKE